MLKKVANWGNYPVMESEEGAFRTIGELKALLDTDRAVIARGNGRCYGDASLSEVTVSTLKYDKITDFDTAKGIITCQSGITLDQLLEVIVPKGWFLPVTPGTQFVTIGGMVASDVHGKNHHVDGAFSRHVLDIELLTGGGELLTCSKDQYPDLLEATCGGMGLTGMILSVRFQLKAIETSYIDQHSIKADNLEELLDLFDKYRHVTYSVAWIDCLKKGKGFGRSILLLGEHAKLPALSQTQLAKGALALPTKKAISFPIHLPGWVLNNFTVKAFNFLYYHKSLSKEAHTVIPYEPFFYPLDAIQHWNRGYGRKGFIQYQFVIPLEHKKGLIQILSRISEKGWGSFLAVLKVFGHQEAGGAGAGRGGAPGDGGIAFPMEGYTLALDFPVREGLFPFLEELDQIVLEYGGRLYLSKDARMSAKTYRSGYVRSADAFTRAIRKYNPQHKFRSVQSSRLAITA
jgi:decaprenylphospho-beta-D-ribofuranose 2-oxidase